MTTTLPFDGIKVADFAWIWAAPTTSKYFADHGATVVRVETESPPRSEERRVGKECKSRWSPDH